MIFQVHNTWTYISGRLSPEVEKAVDMEISFQVNGSKFAIDGWEDKFRKKMIEKKKAEIWYRWKRKPTQSEIEKIEEYWLTAPLKWQWDGRQHFLDKKNDRIPTGLLRRVLAILAQYNVQYQIDDKRIKPNPSLNLNISNFKPFDDQTSIVEDAVKKQRGIVQAPTGFGKTELIAMLIEKLRIQTLVVIHRETIFRQLQSRLQKRLGVPVGVMGGGLNLPHDITVAMMQTVTKPEYKKFLESFPAIIFDECHHLSAPTAYSISQVCKNAFYRYGFSATPWRDDNEDMYIEAALAGFVCKITPTSLISKGRLAKPYIYFIDNPAIQKFQTLSWQKQYIKCIVENEYRNRMVVATAYEMWKVKKTCIIAVTQIKHGEILLGMLRSSYPKIKCKFIQGDVESEEKQKALQQLNNRELDVIVATSVFGEGIDVPSLDCIINAKGQESKIDVYQLLGRALRKLPGKDHAFFIDFMDGEKYTERHSKTRMKVLKLENGFSVKRLWSINDLEREIQNVNLVSDSI